MERRLVAILAADVVGYSRLMGEDEAGTLSTLSRLRKDLIEPLIAEHSGRVVKLMGDGILAEFASVVDAVSCAVAWQSGVSGSDHVPDLRFRIGVNLGDVIFEDGDIYGNGVNVAARLEGLAEPGGICLSGAVHGEVRNKLALEFEDLGEQSVKNIAEPVRAYRVVQNGGADIARPDIARPDIAPQADAEPLEQTGKPSIAVLPFDNMSGDPEQEFFVDGITEDIITALSRSRWYDVTARISTFAYKGASPDVREVARALGVNYVLEGSARTGGGRVRITVQLIDAATGNHVWADRYDRKLGDDFAIQDEIAQRVSSILSERIWQDVARNIRQKHQDTYGPYDYAFRAIELLHRLDPDDVALAEDHLAKALALDPDLLPGHLGLGFCYLLDWLFWGDPSGLALDRAYRHALKLQEIAPNDAQTYRLLSRVYNAKGMYDESWRCVERALGIDPNDGDIIANRGVFHLFKGEFDEATGWFDKVLDLHADTPHTVDIMRYWKSLACFGAGDYPAAVGLLRSFPGLDFVKNQLFSACYARMGQDDEARSRSQAVIRARPGLRLSEIGLWQAFRRDADRRHLFDALRAAGLPVYSLPEISR